MALATCSVRVISRGKGRSAVAAAAYRAGEQLQNASDGLTHNYTRKQGIVYSEILVPAGAPEWAHQRAALWNKVEETERRKDARLAREVLIALPCELSREQNIELARAYAQTFVRQGMVADVSLHDSGDGNPHAHLLLTTRPLEGAEFSKKKNPEWNNIEKLIQWRKDFERLTNDSLARYGHEERICVDSYARQGVDKIPTVHLGTAAHQMEQKGIRTQRGDINRQIEKTNREMAEVSKELASLQKEQKGLEQELSLEYVNAPLEPLEAPEVLSRFPEDTTKPLDFKLDEIKQRENKEVGGGADQAPLPERADQTSPPPPEHHSRRSRERLTREPESPSGSPPPLRRQQESRDLLQQRKRAQEHQQKAAERIHPPPRHRHPEGRTLAQQRRAAQEREPQEEKDAAERTHPPPLHRHPEDRDLAQQRRAAQEQKKARDPAPDAPHHVRAPAEARRQRGSGYDESYDESYDEPQPPSRPDQTPLRHRVSEEHGEQHHQAERDRIKKLDKKRTL